MASSGPAQGKGNIPIYDDNEADKKKDEAPEDQSHYDLIEDMQDDNAENLAVKETEFEFEGDEATLISHFFGNTDLKTIAVKYLGLIKRIPADGQPKALRIRYSKEHAENVDKHIVKMRLEMKKLEKKSFTFKIGGAQKLASFIKEPKRTKDPMCYIADFADSRVDIYGWSYEDISKAEHQLKIYLGEVKATGTRRYGRQHSDSGEDSNLGRNKNTMSYADVVNHTNSGPLNNTIGGYKSSRNNFSRSHSSSDSSRYGSSTDDDDFRFEAELKNGFKLKVYKASITNLEVDVIVNAANENMMHGGGVARVISEAAGWDLDNESADYVKRHGNLKVAENIVTTAGNLRQYKGVIHAVGPIWYQYRDKMHCLDDLGDCVYNILETCKDRKYRTVAMSAISAGIFAVPKELCADMYVDAAARFSKNLEPGDYPEELHIIDIDTSILELVKVSFKKWETNPQSINARVTLPKFLEENPHRAGQPSFGSSNEGHRGQRGQGHGGGGQRYNSGQSQRGERHFSSSPGREPSVDTNIPDKHGLKKHLRKKEDEIFKWRGRAKVYEMDEKITLKIFKGEVTKAQNMNAIVCSTDKDFTSYGYIASAIKTAGGEEFRKSFEKMTEKNKTFAQFGSAFYCKAGKLGVDNVIFVVVDRMLDATPEETKLYKYHIYNILNKADEWEFQKLVIPLFGTGHINTNKDKVKRCCVAVLKGIDKYLKDARDKGKVTDIHLVNNSDTVNQSLIDVFDEGINTAPTSGKKPWAESGIGNNKSDGSQSSGSNGRSYDNSQKESGASGKFSKSFRKDWEKFDDNSAGKDGQKNKEFEKSSGRRLSGSGKSDEHSKGASGEETEEESDNATADEAKSKSPVTKKEAPRKGNIAIFEN